MKSFTLMQYRHPGESGQAAVEAAITMPLTVFLVLATLQLFLVYDARLMAEYAAYRATRAGSVNQGECQRMVHAAIAALLPTVTKTTSAGELGAAFNKFGGNSAGRLSAPHNRLVWIFREAPHRRFLVRPNVPADDRPRQGQDELAEAYGGEDWFDDPDWRPTNPNNSTQLEIRMVYWYRLKIPFANWVLSEMFLTHWGLKSRGRLADPTMVFKKRAKWDADPEGGLGAANAWDRVENPLIYDSYAQRIDAKEYVFPIIATHAMRMMTPAKFVNFQPQHCDAPAANPFN